MRTDLPTIDEYVAGFSGEVRRKLERMRQVIIEAVPESGEAIRYGMPTFRLDGKNMVHFAAQKNHIGFYPTPSVIAECAEELSGYKTSKGAVQFPLEKPLPLELSREMVRFRVKELR